MARNSSIITQGLRGAIGKKIVYKTINGKDIAAIYPDRTHVQFTKKQAAYQNIFKQAAAYASDVIHDPEKNREYMVKMRNGNKHKRAMSVYHYAMQEFLNRHSKKVHRDTIENTLKGYRKIFEPDEQETEVIKYLVAQGEMSNATAE